jgi:hypothetical protein
MLRSEDGMIGLLRPIQRPLAHRWTDGDGHLGYGVPIGRVIDAGGKSSRTITGFDALTTPMAARPFFWMYLQMRLGYSSSLLGRNTSESRILAALAWVSRAEILYAIGTMKRILGCVQFNQIM